jgi:DNA-binding winged helix-turn-helix (wHTH) protein
METTAQPGGRGNSPAGVRFGPFELDLRAGELRNDGHCIRLQEQPFQVLRMLLESLGELVSREEISKRLWPDNTVVEFDHSINAAVKRLRDALRDSAERPRYIETLARRVYRFIGEVGTPERHRAAEPVIMIPKLPEPVPPRTRPRGWRWVIVTAALTVIGFMIGAGTVYYRRGAQPLRLLTRLDLEIESEDSPRGERGTSAILSPDGARLVYVAQSRLFVRRLDQATSTELAGTERAQTPFFSPDGQWVAFFSTNRLKKISLEKRPGD